MFKKKSQLTPGAVYLSIKNGPNFTLNSLKKRLKPGPENHITTKKIGGKYFI